MEENGQHGHFSPSCCKDEQIPWGAGERGEQGDPWAGEECHSDKVHTYDVSAKKKQTLTSLTGTCTALDPEG